MDRRLPIARTLMVLAAGCLLLAAKVPAHAQTLTYNSGQTVAPAYEGWEVDTGGMRYFVFGYMNRNWEEELDVPVGPRNGFAPGPADRGQPTHFLPRRNRFVFRVPVPPDFTERDELVWTLATQGQVEKAYASLRPDYLLDDVVKASETGALGAGTSSPEVRANKAPSVRIEGDLARTATAGLPLRLVAVIQDDDVPKRSVLVEPRTRTVNGVTITRESQPPRRTTVGKTVGLHLSWFVYRGEGPVSFLPSQIKTWEDTRTGANSPWAPWWVPPTLPADRRLVTDVTFSTPGRYMLRALADDGALTGGVDVTVTVIPR